MLMGFILAFLFGIAAIGTTTIQPVTAHAGAPYVKINGEYTPTNPVFLFFENIPFTQAADTSKPVVVGKEVTFEVDTNALGLVTEVPTEFRWQWDTEGKETQDGTTAYYTFTTTGSRMVSLLGHVPNATDYFVLNTIQVDVVPHSGYKVPSVNVSVKPSGDIKINTNVRYQAAVQTDPTAQVADQIWFAPGGTPTGAQLEVKYPPEPIVQYHLFRAVDSNGLWASQTISAVIDNGQVDVYQLSDQEKINQGKSLPTTSLWQRLLIVLAVIVALGLVWWKRNHKV